MALIDTGANAPLFLFTTLPPPSMLFEFYADQPLRSFMKGVLSPKTKNLLSHSFESLGEEILILKRKEMEVYCAKLLEFNHENLLKPVACYDVYDDGYVAKNPERYCCVLFEDHLCCLHELGNLLFIAGREGCGLSTLGRRCVFEIAKTLDFLRVNGCYHGALAMENIYVTDLTDAECSVKLGGVEGLLGCENYERAWTNDLLNFSHSIEEILKANDKTAHIVLKDYVDKLKGQTPATFLFSHALWLNHSRKKSLVLEFSAIDNRSEMNESYWPSDQRLQELASSDTRHQYPKTIRGLTNLLKDTFSHPRYTNAYQN